jgi:hypothetical protein
MRESKKCKVVGRIDKLSEKSAKVFKSRIKDEYHVNMYFTIMKSLLSSIVSQTDQFFISITLQSIWLNPISWIGSL